MRSTLAPHLITAIEHAHCASCYLQNPVIRQSVSSFWPTPPSVLKPFTTCLLWSVFWFRLPTLLTRLRLVFDVLTLPSSRYSLRPVQVWSLSSTPGRRLLGVAPVVLLAFTHELNQCCKSFLEVPLRKFTFKSSTKFVVPTAAQGFKFFIVSPRFPSSSFFMSFAFSGLFCLYITYFVFNSSH